MENQRPEHASEALAMASAARAAVADRLVAPWWFHPAQGLLFAVFVLVITTLSGRSNAGVLAAFAVCVLSIFVLNRVHQRLTGVRIAEGSVGRARWWLWAIAAMIWGGTAAALQIESATSLTWPAWCIAAVVGAASTMMGRRYDAALQRQLRATGA